MSNLTIAVLRGGPSSEYEVSLKTGAAVIKALEAQEGKEGHRVIDILIDRIGQWHRNGVPLPRVATLKGVDVAVIALHGEYGEDGTVQRELDELGVPYIGSGGYGSALAMNKARARFSVAALPMIKLPEHYVVRADDIEVEDGERSGYHGVAGDIFARFGPPYVVKPVSGGSSVGVVVAKNVMELPQAIEYVANACGMPVLVEQHIEGKEVTCSVIDKYRGEECYALPPVEVRMPAGKQLFDYEAKYSTDHARAAEYICPSTLTKEQKKNIEEATKAVHRALELSHYSRSDFILSPHGLYFLEANTLPGLADTSLMPKSLDAVGTTLREFLEHSIDLALSGK
jgi:D-alanine-D-alanine ligase